MIYLLASLKELPFQILNLPGYLLAFLQIVSIKGPV